MTPRSLLDERVVAVQPSLVRAFGLACAVVLQQVHYHAGTDLAREQPDGFAWVPLPYDRFSVETGLSVPQVARAVTKLEEETVLLSCQPEGRSTRRKWYRIDYDHAAFDRSVPIPDSVPSNLRNRAFPINDSVPSSSLSKNEEPRAGARATRRPLGPDELRDPECPDCGGSGVTDFKTVCNCFLAKSQGDSP